MHLNVHQVPTGHPVQYGGKEDKNLIKIYQLWELDWLSSPTPVSVFLSLKVEVIRQGSQIDILNYRWTLLMGMLAFAWFQSKPQTLFS